MAVAAYNPEKRKQAYERNKEHYLEYSRIYHLNMKFNITPEQYAELEEKQNGVCAICHKTCTRKLAVDHDHSTGKVRGLLCNNCNRGIGHLKESRENLLSALAYLEEYK